MSNDLENKIQQAMSHPQNIGEMKDADAVGSVGNSECGEMLRMWVKYKEGEKGQRVIDRATFQSFGCETAIAVASMATERIKGKTAEEVLAMSGQELAADLGPLPPMKIHCAELVEGALRSALQGGVKGKPDLQSSAPESAPSSHLMNTMTQAREASQERKIVFLPKNKEE